MIQPEFTMISAERKCPLCGGEFFLLKCICGQFYSIDLSEISSCFLLEPDRRKCDLSCYFECKQRNIVIDLADDLKEIDNLCCCRYDKIHGSDKLSITRNLMQIGYKITPVKSQVPKGKISNIRTNSKQLKSNHFVLLNEKK